MPPKASRLQIPNTKLKTASEMQITQQPTQDDLCHAIFFMQIN